MEGKRSETSLKRETNNGASEGVRMGGGCFAVERIKLHTSSRHEKEDNRNGLGPTA